MHIGNKIKEEVAKRNISVTDFAKFFMINQLLMDILFVLKKKILIQNYLYIFHLF